MSKTVTSRFANKQLIFCLIIFSVSVLLYMRTLNFGYVNFDDHELILQNKSFFEKDFTLAKVFTTDAWLKNESVFYRPLQNLSFEIDTIISGRVENPFGYHLTSVLFFSILALSLFFLFIKFGIDDKWAFYGTLLYVVHPIFVSSASWIPARGDLFLTIFSIWSIYYFMSYVKVPSIKNGVLTGLFFALALFSKETAVFLPLVYLFYFYAFNTSKKIKKADVFLAVFITLLVSLWYFLRSISINVSIDKTGGVFDFASMQIIPTAISNLFIPIERSTLPLFSTLYNVLGFVFLLFIVFLILKSEKKSRVEKYFFLFWFLILLIPAFIFRATSILDYLEHRLLLPLVGIYLFIFKILSDRYVTISSKQRLGIIMLLVIFIVVNITKQSSFKNQYVFYDTAIKNGSNPALAFNNRGVAKKDSSDFKGALSDFSMAIELDSTYSESYNNRGILKCQFGDNLGAIEDFNKAIKFKKTDADFITNRAMARLAVKDIKGALLDYSLAIRLNKNNPNAYYQRGVVYKHMGDIKKALLDLERSVSLNKTNPLAFYEIGYCYGVLGQYQLAIANFNEAISLDEYSECSYQYRAVAEYKLGNYEQSINDCNRLLEINPNNKDAMSFKEEAIVALQKRSGN